MRSFSGLMRAYWFSDRWMEAWALTAVIALFTAAASKTSVWMAEASGELVNSIAFFHDPSNTAPLPYLLNSAGLLLLLVFLKDAGIIGIRHLVSTTLHRKWRGWLNGRFNEALLDGNHTHFHLQHGGRDANGMPVLPPDNMDQRVQESIKGMTGGAIGLAMGIMGVVTSLIFVGQKLIEQSTVVDGLEFLGTYGAAVLAFAAVGDLCADQHLSCAEDRRPARAAYRRHPAHRRYVPRRTDDVARRSFHVSASHGEDVQKKMHARLYTDIDRTWTRLNWVHSAYQSFELIYDFLAARIIAYLPGLIPYMNDKISLKSYITGAELVNSLISQCSWFIHVMPAIATLKANAKRVSELACAIENVQHPDDFYTRTGRREFTYGTQDPIFGLTIRNLNLMHQGADAKPFLTIRNMRFRRGEWTYVRGESGSGKTSLIKAINGLWPHGRGSIVFPKGVKTFYAAQEVKLPQLTLEGARLLAGGPDGHSDARVAAALHKAGLGEFIEHLDAESREGKIWDQVLSGGQKQKLVAARILLHQPGLLFLDEASGALDPEAKMAFHQAIKDNCPARNRDQCHARGDPATLGGRGVILRHRDDSCRRCGDEDAARHTGARGRDQESRH